MAIIWDIVTCSLVEIDQRFKVAYCLHQAESENLGSHLGSGQIRQKLSLVSGRGEGGGLE
jgi:hypothetical protein